MKNLLWVICLAIVPLAAAQAQDAELHPPRADNNFVPNVERQPPHDASYSHYETPQELVFRNAALRGAQRRERMALNAYFGYSPSRPPASTLPFMSSPIAPPAAYRAYSNYPGFVFPRPYGRF